MTVYVIAGYKTGREGNVYPSGQLVEFSDVVFKSEVVFKYESASERQQRELVFLNAINSAFYKGADLVMLARKSEGSKDADKGGRE